MDAQDVRDLLQVSLDDALRVFAPRTNKPIIFDSTFRIRLQTLFNIIFGLFDLSILIIIRFILFDAVWQSVRKVDCPIHSKAHFSQVNRYTDGLFSRYFAALTVLFLSYTVLLCLYLNLLLALCAYFSCIFLHYMYFVEWLLGILNLSDVGATPYRGTLRILQVSV